MGEIAATQNIYTLARGPESKMGNIQLPARGQGKAGMNMQIGYKIQKELRNIKGSSFCKWRNQAVRTWPASQGQNSRAAIVQWEPFPLAPEGERKTRG